MILNALCIDVDDLIASFQEAGYLTSSPFGYFVEKETYSLLEGLDDLKIKATFFIPGFVTTNFPSLVKLIAEQGHDIASHGTCHKLVKYFSPKEFAEDIRCSKYNLENLSGLPVDTFKAPIWGIDKHNLWALDILANEGIKIDHSLMPSPLKKLNLDPLRPSYLENGLLVIPPTHYYFYNFAFPVFGGFYNAYQPSSLQAYLFNNLNINNIPFNYYFHPFEYKCETNKIQRIRANFNLGLYSAHAGVYEKHLSYLANKFNFSTLKEAYKEYFQ